MASRLIHCIFFAPIFMLKLNTEPEIGGARSCLRQNAGKVSAWLPRWAWGTGSGPQGKSCKPPAKAEKTLEKKTKKKTKKIGIIKLRVATWNVSTLKPIVKHAEVCETLSR